MALAQFEIAHDEHLDDLVKYYCAADNGED